MIRDLRGDKPVQWAELRLPPRAPAHCSVCSSPGHNRATCPQREAQAVVAAAPEQKLLTAFRVTSCALEALSPDERRRLVRALHVLYGDGGIPGGMP